MPNLIILLDKIYRGFIDFFTQYTDKIVISLLILFVGFILARLLERIINKVLNELEINNILKKTTKIRIDVEKMISRIVAFIIYFITIIAVLNNIGLTTTVLNILLSAILLIIVISFILAVKDFIPNFFAGIIIQKKGIIKEKDHIKFSSVEGVVKEIGALQTIIINDKKDIIFVPNSTIIKSKIKIKKDKDSQKK